MSTPAGFEKIMRELNARPQTTVCVADNEKKDFLAPNKLGCTTIQLIRPARVHTESADQPGTAAQYVIGEITELPPLLEKLQG